MRKKELNKYIGQLNDLLPVLDRYFHLPHAGKFCGIKVTLQQYLALNILARKGRCMMGDLSKALDIALSTMTELAGRLAKKDLIDKVRDNKDQRVVWVNLTEKGSKIFQEIKKKKQKHISSILENLSYTECEALIGILRIVTRASAQAEA